MLLLIHLYFNEAMKQPWVKHRLTSASLPNILWSVCGGYYTTLTNEDHSQFYVQRTESFVFSKYRAERCSNDCHKTKTKAITETITSASD